MSKAEEGKPKKKGERTVKVARNARLARFVFGPVGKTILALLAVGIVVTGGVFIHYNGSYHSDNHESIEWYLKEYERGFFSTSLYPYTPTPTKIITISTRTQNNVTALEKENLGIADFIIVTPENMTRTH